VSALTKDASLPKPLGDTRDQTAWGDTYEGEGKELQDHALVCEVYLRPSPKYPNGRKVVGTKAGVELFDGIYDKKLADNSDYAETDWHPFSFAGWHYSPRKFWPKTPFEDIIPHQINLNKLWQGLLEDDKNFKGWSVNAKGTVDWEMVRESYANDGTPNIQYEEGEQPPTYVPPPRINSDKIGKINLTISRMNDIMAQYETTRGNADPNVKSGKQADVMQNAANSQATPLLTAIVSLYVAHWTKVTHLMAVHFNDGPRDIRFEDPDSGEVITDTFKADDIKSDDIVLFGGNAFFMSREEYNAELDRLQATGAFNSPKGMRSYLKLRNTFIPEDTWNPDATDIKMAKWENDRFSKGLFSEDRPYILQPIEQQYQQEVMQYAQAAQMYPELLDQWKTAKDRFDTLNKPYKAAMFEQMQLEKEGKAQYPGDPPVDPGLQPQPPPKPVQSDPWWRAQGFENAQVHIEEHENFRKTLKYQKLCFQYPELDTAMTFHILDHIKKEAMYQKQKQDIVAAIMPPMPQPGQQVPVPAQGAKQPM
jgi:hypothetical protein